MEKYTVLFLIIVYFIAAGLTSTLFYPQYGVGVSIMGASPTTFKQGQGLGDIGLFWRFIEGGFSMAIPGVPLIISLFLMTPMYIMIAYFVYLNIPEVSILGISLKTKQP